MAPFEIRGKKFPHEGLPVWEGRLIQGSMLKNVDGYPLKIKQKIKNEVPIVISLHSLNIRESCQYYQPDF